jgi:hypothetical protein
MIEIKKGPGLRWPIQQKTLVLGGSTDLRTLNAGPYQLLPAGYHYNVLNVNLFYDLVNCATTDNLYIGYQTLLTGNVLSSFCDFVTANLGLGPGVIGLGTRVQNFSYANMDYNEPLVLWQNINDTTASYNYFILTITYIQFPFDYQIMAI